MDHRIEEHDLLAWIEGEMAPERARLVEAALDADPGLRRWAEAVARDRETLRASCAEAERRVPRGLVEDAIAVVERRALVGADSMQGGRRERRLRLTPARMALAASLLVGFSLLSLWPLLTGSFSPGRRASHGPVAVAPSPEGEEGPAMAASSESAGESTTLAMRDSDAARQLRSSEMLDSAAPVIADADSGWQGSDTAQRIARSRAEGPSITPTPPESLEFTDETILSEGADPASGERFAAIAMSDETAAALARQGRLALLIETTDLALAERRVRALSEGGALDVSMVPSSGRDAAAALGAALLESHLPGHTDASRLIHYTFKISPTVAMMGELDAALSGAGMWVRRVALPEAIAASESPTGVPGSPDGLLNLHLRSASLPVVVIRPHGVRLEGSGGGAGPNGPDESR